MSEINDTEMNGVAVGKASHITTHDHHAAATLTSPHSQPTSNVSHDLNSALNDDELKLADDATSSSNASANGVDGATDSGADDDDTEVSIDENLEEDELLQLTPEYKSLKRSQSSSSTGSSMEPLRLQGDTALDRLDYLLQQTEQFAALVKPKHAPPTPSQHGRNRESVVCVLSSRLQLEDWTVCCPFRAL